MIMPVNKVKIHSIGDSHSWHAWCKIPGAIVRTLGPMTMHGFGTGKPIVVHNIPENDIAILSWGEIDCRCHVFKHPPYKECIDKLVNDYVIGIEMNQQLHKNIWLNNVTPPIRRTKDIPNSPSFPFLGSNEERLSYVLYMNKKLKETGYPFLETYWQYADKDGFLNMKKSDGFVHIAEPQGIMDYLDLMLADRGMERETC